MGWTRTALSFPLSCLLLAFASLTAALVRPCMGGLVAQCSRLNCLSAIMCTRSFLFTIGDSLKSIDPKYALSYKFDGVSAIFAVVAGIVGAILMIQFIILKVALRYSKQKINEAMSLFKKVCAVTREPTGEHENTPLTSSINYFI